MDVSQSIYRSLGPIVANHEVDWLSVVMIMWFMLFADQVLFTFNANLSFLSVKLANINIVKFKVSNFLLRSLIKLFSLYGFFYFIQRVIPSVFNVNNAVNHHVDILILLKKTLLHDLGYVLLRMRIRIINYL